MDLPILYSSIFCRSGLQTLHAQNKGLCKNLQPCSPLEVFEGDPRQQLPSRILKRASERFGPAFAGR